MSQVHEHLSPETYGITFLPIIKEECEHDNIVQGEECCTHDEAYQVELNDGNNLISVDWYCEECGEYIDPEDYRGE